MNITLIILLVLAVILFFRLMNLLGTRTGFEPEKKSPNLRVVPDADDAEVVEPEADNDVDEFAHDDATADALNAAKAIEPDFRVAEFLSGARGAYEFVIESFSKAISRTSNPLLTKILCRHSKRRLMRGMKRACALMAGLKAFETYNLPVPNLNARITA